jgi:hypothetical protein
VDLKDRFETIDGSRPDASPLTGAVGREIPLAAFAVLTGGDAFEDASERAPSDGEERAHAFVARRVKVKRHFVSRRLVELVTGAIVEQLAGNPSLTARLERQRPLVIDLVPEGKALGRYGFPDNVVPNAAGLFWDHPSWERARIALREEHLEKESALVVHEMAHAIHYLAFTAKERELIYKVLRPTFGSRAAMDEVFAIYSEREFLPTFDEEQQRAPGVYGVTRRQWDENHLFTRFVRKLYFPYKKLAGRAAPSDMAQGRSAWAKFSGA